MKIILTIIILLLNINKQTEIRYISQSFLKIPECNSFLFASENIKNKMKLWEGLVLKHTNESIGYGHLTHDTSAIITKKDAEILFEKDIMIREFIVKKIINKKLNQNQFDACLSFLYNCGEVNLNMLQVSNFNFKSFVYAKRIKLNGLVKRRQYEDSLFNN